MTPAKYADKLTPARLRDIEAAAWWERDNADRNAAEHEVSLIVAGSKAARPIRPDMRDAEIKHMAQGRADAITAVIAQHVAALDWWAWLGAIVRDLGGRPIDIEARGVDRAGVLLRYQCRDWWTRQLRRAVVQLREAIGRERAEVCARRRQPYLTDDTVRRLIDRDKAARAMLESTEIESEAGDVVTLAQAADASTSNPAIRRGELMTRITGCERWADARGWHGLFTTHTTPSRFHAVRHDGKENPRWTEAGCPTVKAGQAWLCKTWARARAAMARRGLEVFGLRVAEPHQDGTPHWHMMLWCKPGQAGDVAEVLFRYWLKDTPNERGALEHRFKAKAMEAGGAAGYVAKYISKGIDDAGAVGDAGHVDDAPDGQRVTMEQADMFGGGAARVRMWARAHGIRQFQAIGQPPVTVWRELRRVEASEAEQAPGVVREMWDAVNRDGERRACWATYLERQGGACVGRLYRVQVWTEDREQAGRYETATQARPVGVLDRLDELEQVVRSARKEWKPKGAWNGTVRRVRVNDEGGASHRAGGHVDAGRYFVRNADGDLVRGGAARGVGVDGLTQGAQPRAAWTRVNNCTPGKPQKLVFDWWEVFGPDSIVAAIEKTAGGQVLRGSKQGQVAHEAGCV